ncbi:hypothetical protein TNCV_4761031 [Trichonephila clavipes]|uniref:Uncharacterized protein n=1 Tax=Trichonephila clavipes TaxID=2585209 RepID=A0A8X6V4V3_TRICX|nr:hypothetical protein TNCV_4761031 [Trichonephila clavipes]
MIPFIKRFSYLHLNNLDDLQPYETELKGIVPSPRCGRYGVVGFGKIGRFLRGVDITFSMFWVYDDVNSDYLWNCDEIGFAYVCTWIAFSELIRRPYLWSSDENSVAYNCPWIAFSELIRRP